MSQVDQNLAFSIEIAVFISVDVVEAVVLREGGIWDNRRLVAFPVSELLMMQSLLRWPGVVRWQ